MKDIPIIFSAPMVQALLAGRKTMTRRLAWQPYKRLPKILHPLARLIHNVTHRPSLWQNVKPGDRLWVRETFRTEQIIIDGNPFMEARYPDDQIRREFDPMRYKPSIHMPRWASRLTLVVTAAKIERLTAITIKDIWREGLVPMTKDQHSLSADEDLSGQWEELWDRLHGEGAYAEGPDVVALTFTVHQSNIDALKVAA